MAQAAIRPSDISLTIGVYTDPEMPDVREAPAVLPVPADRRGGESRDNGSGTKRRTREFAPKFAPRECKPGQSKCPPTTGKLTGGKRMEDDEPAASAMGVKRKGPPSAGDGGPLKSGRRDLNPRPLAPQASALAKLRHGPNEPVPDGHRRLGSGSGENLWGRGRRFKATCGLARPR